MKLFTLGIKTAVLLFFSFQMAFAEVLDFSIHQDYTSVRALGMGNAFSAVVDDHNAIFYNPAALARREDGKMRFFLKLAASDGWDSLASSLEGSSTEIADSLAQNNGNHYFFNIPTLGFTWVRPNWGIAFIPVDFNSTMSVHNQLGPQLGINLYLDTTFAYSYARDWAPKFLGNGDQLSVGITGKAINRIYYSDAVDAATLSVSGATNTDRASEGLTFDADVALLYTPQISESGYFKFLRYSEPTFSLAIRNVLDMGYPVQVKMVSKLDDVPTPPKLQRRMDIGSKFDLPNFWVFKPKLALEMRDIMHSNWNYYKGFHAGAELEWEMSKWWRGTWALGINQGYMTAGLGAKLGVFQIDLATWGEEVGMSDAKKENRRYVLELSADF